MGKHDHFLWKEHFNFLFCLAVSELLLKKNKKSWDCFFNMSGLFPLPLQIRWSLLRLKGLWAFWNWQHPTSWGWRKVGEGKLCNLWVRVVGSCLLWSHRCTLQFEEDLRQPIQDNCGLLCSSTLAAKQKIAAKYSSRGNAWSLPFHTVRKATGHSWERGGCNLPPNLACRWPALRCTCSTEDADVTDPAPPEWTVWDVQHKTGFRHGKG